MKKKLSLLLVMVMALTMVLGTGVSAWADPLETVTEVSIGNMTPSEGQSTSEFF